MTSEPNFFERKGVVAAFGILALLGGIYFTYPSATGQVTGNVIGNNIFSTVPFIGILLLICSIVLLSYATVKKK